MHPTPRIDEDDREFLREKVYFEIELEELTELIDATIRLVKKIDAALGGKFGRVNRWIQDREPNGTFAKSVFD